MTNSIFYIAICIVYIICKMKVKMHNLNLKKTLIKDASENTNTPNPLAILIYFIISLSTKDKKLVSYIISNDLQSLAHLGNVYRKK